MDLLRNVELWRGASAAEKETIRDQIVELLGSPWEAEDGWAGELGLPVLCHSGCGVELVAIVVGEFQMGASEEELAEIEVLYGDRAEEALASFACSNPTRIVQVKPFLSGRRPLTAAQFDALAAGGDREGGKLVDEPAYTYGPGAEQAAAALGMRLPSEAEWEYVARELGARRWLGKQSTSVGLGLDSVPFEENAFGVYLGEVEAMADAWHQTYEGAPRDARPYGNGSPPVVSRGTTVHSWQDEVEAVRLHVANRACYLIEEYPCWCRPARGLGNDS